MRESDGIAAARRILGQRLARLRQAAGYSQHEFAPLTNYARTSIANVEVGRQNVPRRFWERCEDLLAADGALLAAFDEIDKARRRELREQASTDSTGVPGVVSLVQRGHEPPATDETGDDPTKRRQALGLVGMALAQVALPTTLDALDRVDSEPRSGGVDQRQVLAHQQLAEALAGLYRSGDPRVSLPLIAVYADSLLELLNSAMTEQQRAELLAVAVGVHAQAGLWACHMHRGAVAYRYLATACELAAAAGDGPLRARALGAMSYLYSSAPRGGMGGHPLRALGLLDEALDLAARADPFTRGWLATWRADQHATLGQVAPARTDVETAQTCLSAHDDNGVVGFFSRPHYGYGMQGHLDSVRGVVMALDGQADESARTFLAVQASARNMRRRVSTHGHEALTHVADGDADAAAIRLQEALRLAVREDYGMGVERVMGVRRGFPGQWAGRAPVRELDEQLHDLARA